MIRCKFWGLLQLNYFFSICLFGQQLPEQKAFLENAFLQNPAMTAPFYKAKFGLAHRTFWTDFDNAPQSYSIFGQYPLKKGGVGLVYQTDKFGVWEQNMTQATYAYQIDLGRGQSPQLAIGIGAGILSSSYNFREIIANNLGDPLIPEQLNKNQLFTSSGGIYFTTTDKANEEKSHLAIGIAGRIVLPQKELFFTAQQNQPQKRVIHANALIKYRKVNDVNYWYLEPAIWLDYTHHIKLLSPVFQFQFGHSEIFGLGARYRFLGDLSLQFLFKLESFWDRMPLTGGVNIIRPINQTRIGQGWGIFLQYTLDTY